MAAEAQEARRVAQNFATTVRRFTPLAQKLGLGPEQSQRLFQLIMDAHEAGVDFAAASAHFGQDVSQNPDIYWTSVDELKAQIQNQIKALLGDDGYVEYLAATLAANQSAVIDFLQKRLKPAGGQLSDEQAGQLLAVLQGLKTARVSDEVVTRASGFLSPTQLGTLTEYQQRQTAGPKVESRQNAIQQNLPATPAVSPGK